MQTFVEVRQVNGNIDDKQDDIGIRKSVKKSHSLKSESALVKSRNNIFDDDDDDHFDAGCDNVAIGQENIRVQHVRESSWASMRAESISNSSTKSRKRLRNDNGTTGRGDALIKTRSSNMVSSGKKQLISDDNIYGIGYSKNTKVMDVDDVEENTVSNSVKRSLIKQ